MKAHRAMKAQIRTPQFLAWLALVVATALSTLFGDGLGPAKLAAVGVIAVAFFKVHVVGLYFMELRGAAPVLLRCFTAWTVVVPTALIGIYLIA